MRMTMRLTCVLVLGLAVSACDKCGDHFWNQSGTPKSCSAGPKAQ